MATANVDLSSRTESQASTLEEVAASLEQFGSSIAQSAGAAGQADELAHRAAALAGDSGRAVKNVVQTMTAIDASARQIAEITGVIDSIAFQTNILALNAAVEAARAGEQGRGFAVVATEVRSLAQRSAVAAKDIKQLIDASVASVKNGVGAVNTAGQNVDEVVAEISRVAGSIAEIATTAEEQKNNVAHVNQAISTLDSVTQQNGAMVEESAAATLSLEQQAERLMAAIKVFDIGDGSLPPAPKQTVSGLVTHSQSTPRVVQQTHSLERSNVLKLVR